MYVMQQENCGTMVIDNCVWHLWKAIWKIAVGGFLALMLFLLLVPATPAAAHSTPQAPRAPTLNVEAGFCGYDQYSDWTPVYVTINNTGPAFTGSLSVRVTSNSSRGPITSVSPWSFGAPVSLAAGAHKEITLYAPFYIGNFQPSGVIAQLLDAHGHVVASQQSQSVFEIDQGNLFIGMLTDMQIGCSDTLNNLSLPGQTSSLTLAPLDASTMPTSASVLASFQIIILDDFTTSTLSPAQLSALQIWVNQGGVLIEAGGPQWRRTLSALPADLLPVRASGTTTLPAKTDMLSVGSSIHIGPGVANHNDILPISATISTGTSSAQPVFSQSETILASTVTPLIVQAHEGQGVISYLAFDPMSAPFANWPGTNDLWEAVMLHAFGDRFLDSNPAYTSPPTLAYPAGPGDILTRGGILGMIEPQSLLGPWIIIVLLLGYLVIIGPVRFLIVKHYKLPRWWTWRIVIGAIVIFSLLSYTLSSLQRQASFTDNSISLIQMSQNGSLAHATTYMGIFVPNQGTFDLHLPGQSLAQPIPDQLLSSAHSVTSDAADAAPTSLISGSNGTDMQRQASSPWSLHSIVAEQDADLHGQVITQLALRNNRLVGTITNTLPSALSDVYVLVAHSFAAVGHLAAGETRQINLPLYSSPSRSGQTLADLIAQHGGLPTPYFPYQQNKRPQNDFQRHMALLSALNGAGYTYPSCNGPCNTHAIISGGTIYVTGGQVPNPNVIAGPDPLLLPGTQATLIGWADQPIAPADNATINGARPTGQHEDFLQIPLNISLSSLSSTPPDFIMGHVIDINSYDAHLELPGIYSLSNGSLNFEFTPVPSTQPVHALTITEPDFVASPLYVQLYNWRTGKWDAITLSGNTLRTTNTAAYMGPGGRVLMQVGNQPHSQNKLFFGQPWLSLR
jgi:hypothetical protein